MRKEWPLFFLISPLFFAPGNAKNIEHETLQEISESSRAALLKGHFVINSQVDSLEDGKFQRLDFLALGLHSKNCQEAMVKLSRYEIYPHYLDFIKEVNYNQETEFLSFTIDHTLLPFRMGIEFNVPRIKGVGIFNFKFDKGFLKNLTGSIELSENDNYKLVPKEAPTCLFKITSKWQGPHTKIPKTIFELFSTTLTRMALEKMFRISGSE